MIWPTVNDDSQNLSQVNESQFDNSEQHETMDRRTPLSVSQFDFDGINVMAFPGQFNANGLLSGSNQDLNLNQPYNSGQMSYAKNSVKGYLKKIGSG